MQVMAFSFDTTVELWNIAETAEDRSLCFPNPKFQILNYSTYTSTYLKPAFQSAGYLTRKFLNPSQNSLKLTLTLLFPIHMALQPAKEKKAHENESRMESG